MCLHFLIQHYGVTSPRDEATQLGTSNCDICCGTWTPNKDKDKTSLTVQPKKNYFLPKYKRMPCILPWRLINVNGTPLPCMCSNYGTKSSRINKWNDSGSKSFLLMSSIHGRSAAANGLHSHITRHLRFCAQIDRFDRGHSGHVIMAVKMKWLSSLAEDAEQEGPGPLHFLLTALSQYVFLSSPHVSLFHF